MDLTRRGFLGACLAASSVQPWLHAGGSSFEAGAVGPVEAWRSELIARRTGRTWAAASPTGTDPDEFPWEKVGQLLRQRYRDLRRHFVFEYYPWYSAGPFRHWDQWDRVPPVDLAANTIPWLGAYDSLSATVLEQHARWMADAGVGVINLSWWGIGSFEDRAVPLVMDVMRAHDIHVAFHLEPYGPDRVKRLSSDLKFILTEYGEKRRWDGFFFHERANGSQGPVFKLFRTTLPQQVVDCHGVVRDVEDFVPNSEWARATDQVRAMLDGTFDHVTLLSDTWDAKRAKAAGLDGIAIYDPALEREEWLGYAVAATRHRMPFSFDVNPGLDEIGRRGLPAGSCLTPRPFLPRASSELVWSSSVGRERARQLSEQRIDETLEWTLLLQTHPWLGNVDQGFFLVYITSFNEWHEGSQFEPMKPRPALTPTERAMGYHNPTNGFYRLDRLTDLLRRLGH